MQVIKWQIEELTRELKALKDEERESFLSVKEKWNSSYHNDLKSRSEMIFYLIQGKKYNPYSFGSSVEFRVAKTFKENKSLGYCNFYYDTCGNDEGFVAPANALFNAIQSFHKKMWICATTNNGEVCSFSGYVEKLRDNTFLIESFNNHVKESGTGVYSTKPYLIEYEEKRIKSGKWYVWIENTTRRL